MCLCLGFDNKVPQYIPPDLERYSYLTWQEFSNQDSVEFTVENFYKVDDLITVSQFLQNIHLPLGSLCVRTEIFCSVESLVSSPSLLDAEDTAEGSI